MEYTFTARVAERWPNEIQLVPEDEPAFLEFVNRSGIESDPYWHGAEIFITVGARALVDRIGTAERVRYTVENRGTRMYGVGVEPI